MIDDDEDLKSIVPHIPFYCADGCSVVEEWSEDFMERAGNRAVLTVIRFKNKKGKISDPVVIRVEWKK